MKAEIKSILPVTETYEWNEIQLEDNWNHYEWFTLDIGIKGESGSDIFYALVATRAAEHIAKKENSDSYCFIVDTFDKESIINVLSEYISNISGSSWNQISEEISKVMEWEYEWIA